MGNADITLPSVRTSILSLSEESRRVREQVMNQKGYSTYSQMDLLYGQSSVALATVPHGSFGSTSSSSSTIEGSRRQCALWRSGPLHLRCTCFGFLVWAAKTNDPTFPRLPIPSFAPLRPKKHKDRGKSAITTAEDLYEDILDIAFEEMATG